MARLATIVALALVAATLATGADAVCSAYTCGGSSAAGYRLTTVSTTIYSQPCASSSVVKTVPRCTKVYYSGATKVASNCAYNKDNFCWVRVTSPATGYIKNFECSNPSGTQYLVMYPNYQTCRPCTESAPSRAAVAAVAKSLADKTLSYTQVYTYGPSPGGWRWSGINGGSTGYYRCPYSLPQYADCSSFVSWLYWTAFGWGPDYLNGLDWRGGATGSMTGFGRSLGTNIDAARPGDLIFYPDSNGVIGHVAIYVGGKKAISFGQNTWPKAKAEVTYFPPGGPNSQTPWGPVNLVTWNYRTVGHIRTYDAFPA